jgi:O-antigen/teichoic acid export membrane protein
MTLEALPGSKARTISSVSASDQGVLLAAKGGLIAFVGNLVASGTRFAFGIVLARLLGAELLGMYNLSLTFATVVGGVAQLGLASAMARYVPIAVNEEDEPSLWGIIQTGIGLPTLIGSVLALGLFLLAEPISLRVFNSPNLAPALRLASLSIPLAALINMLAAITQGFKRMEYKVYAQDAALNVSKLIMSVALIGIGWSLMGAIAAHVLASALTVALFFYFVHLLFPLNRPLRGAKRKTGEMLGFTLPLYISGLLGQSGASLETVILGALGIMSDVGIYSSALRLAGVGSMFYTSLQRISIPMISDLYSQRKFDQLERVYQVVTKWAIAFNLPIFLTSVFFAVPLLSLFGKDFTAGAVGLVILAFGSLFNAGTGVCGSVVTMTGHSKVTLANSIVSLAVNLFLDLLLIPRWGIVGAALATTTTGVLVNVLRIAQVYIFLRIWPYNRSFMKPILAALFAGSVTLLFLQQVRLGSILIQFTAGTALLWSTYALAILALKLSPEDRMVLDKAWGRVNSRWRPKS